MLGVYIGSRVDALSLVVSNDDEATGIKTSKLTFTATAGTSYQIAVDGKNADSGLVVWAR